MSNWTHVAGVIRVNHMACLGEPPWKTVEHALGNIPYGSEGFLNYKVWENPQENCIAYYTITIFGDLRDHDDAQEVINWFKEVCNNFGWIRNAVITAENEQNGTITWTWEDNGND